MNIFTKSATTLTFLASTAFIATSSQAIPLHHIAPDSQKRIGGVNIAWSYAGPVDNMHCIAINEPAEPAAHTWGDNYFCTSTDIGASFHYAGPDYNKRCVHLSEGSDPHTWHDNYLCLPHTSPYHLHWESWISGRNQNDAIRFFEPADPHTWHDNFLFVYYDANAVNDPLDTFLKNNALFNGSNPFLPSFTHLKGWLSVDSMQTSTNPQGIVEVTGYIRPEGFIGDNPLSIGVREALKAMQSFGLRDPIPFKITNSIGLNGSLSIDLELQLIDTWRNITINPLTGTEYKFNTLNLTVSMTSDLVNSGEMSIPLKVSGQGYMKTLSRDNFIAIRPEITVTVGNEGTDVAIGGDIAGQCPYVPYPGMNFNDCNQTWNVLNLGIMTGHSKHQPDNTWRIGRAVVTYSNGKFSGLEAAVDNAQLHGLNNTATFYGHFNTDLTDPNNWNMAGHVNFHNLTQHVSGHINVLAPSFFLSMSRSINVEVLKGTQSMTIGTTHMAANFSGEVCLPYASRVCSWLPWPLGEACDFVTKFTCTPNINTSINTNGQVCIAGGCVSVPN